MELSPDLNINDVAKELAKAAYEIDEELADLDKAKIITRKEMEMEFVI